MKITAVTSAASNNPTLAARNISDLRPSSSGASEKASAARKGSQTLDHGGGGFVQYVRGGIKGRCANERIGGDSGVRISAPLVAVRGVTTGL